jgi:adenylylsulfate kinase
MLMGHGKVVWFTGLSGSGKSSLCTNVAESLKSQTKAVQILDADEVRKGLCSDLGFSLEDRFENVRRIAYVANLLAQNGIVVLVAAICPLNEMRRMVRTAIPGLIEVFVDAPLHICEARDPKALYSRARKGLIAQVTGIDSPFEPPSHPTITCHTDIETLPESTQKVLMALTSQSKLLAALPLSHPQQLSRGDDDKDLYGRL